MAVLVAGSFAFHHLYHVDGEELTYLRALYIWGGTYSMALSYELGYSPYEAGWYFMGGRGVGMPISTSGHTGTHST